MSIVQKSALVSVREITFDMYGTLLDLEASFEPGFDVFVKSKGYSGDAADIVQMWETTYLHESNVDSMLGRVRTPFEVIRRVTLSQLFYKLKIDHTKDDIELLLTKKATPALFPDVRDTLTRLNNMGKYRLSILSNGDLKSLESVVDGLELPVSLIISAEQAGYYKPHAGVYNHAIKELRAHSEQVLHVATHAWDVRGAKAVGMLGAYVNRYEIPYVDVDGSQADLETGGLDTLADELA